MRQGLDGWLVSYMEVKGHILESEGGNIVEGIGGRLLSYIEGQEVV